MKKVSFLLIFSTIAMLLHGQSVIFDVFISQDSEFGYTQLNWDEPLTLTHTIKRKEIGDNNWTVIDSSFTGNQYIDSSSVTGQAYEYKVTHFDKLNPATYRYALTYSGFEVPRTDFRGRFLVLVDSLYETQLQSKIDRLILDLEGDGWSVIQKSVSQSTESEDVKALIREEYESQDGLEAVFLLGHIPVTYSGYINPDGHLDHLGPWPADVYYGEMNESWTVNPFETELSNNKVEDVEIQVGRVDFHDMPAFEESELELLKAYLDKNHAFRQKHFSPNMKATYKSNFGGSAYDHVAEVNFPTLVGKDNTSEGNYRNDLLEDSYIWSFGAGPGTYTSAGGISNSNTMATDSLQGVFTMLFGSYFGDWNNTNNYLRSVLGSGTMLTSCWGSRPTWVLFHMGLGTNIGFQTQLSQADSLYISNFTIKGATGMMDTLEDNNYYSHSIHIALLGDPSLRMHMMQPITDLSASETTEGIDLEWQYDISADAFTGFNVFKKPSGSNYFELVASVSSDVLSFTDETVNTLGSTKYMVRPERLELTPSGSFYNQATGVQTNVEITFTDLDGDGFTNLEDCDDTNAEVNPDQTEVPYNGLDDDCDITTLDDDFDQDGFPLAEDCDDDNADINPDQIEEPYNGIDDDCNVATLDDDLDQDGFLLVDDCDDENSDINPDAEEIPNNGIDEDCDGFDLMTSTHELANSTISIYPNPATDIINIDIVGQLSYQVTLLDVEGKVILSESNSPKIQVNNLPSGTYILELRDTKTGNKIVDKILVGNY